MRRWIPGKSAVQLNSIQEEAQLTYKVSEQASLKRNLIMIRYLFKQHFSIYYDTQKRISSITVLLLKITL